VQKRQFIWDPIYICINIFITALKLLTALKCALYSVMCQVVNKHININVNGIVYKLTILHYMYQLFFKFS